MALFGIKAELADFHVRIHIDPTIWETKLIALSPQIKPSIFAKLVVSTGSRSVWIYGLTTANIVARRRSPYNSWTSFTKEFLLLDGILSQISRVPGSIVDVVAFIASHARGHDRSFLATSAQGCVLSYSYRDPFQRERRKNM